MNTNPYLLCKKQNERPFVYTPDSKPFLRMVVKFRVKENMPGSMYSVQITLNHDIKTRGP